MINLLPDDKKHDIRAARMNVVLLRYNFLTLGGVGLLALFCLLFYGILQNAQSMAVSANKDNNAKAASYADVRQEATEYRKNLLVARQIFANSVSYTDIINAITKIIPDGVVLNSLNLGQTLFGQQTLFSAQAKTYDDAIKLKQNFQSSSLFSNVYLQTLSSGSDTNSSGLAYPVSITISAKLNKAEAL